MPASTTSLEVARTVADTLLYERCPRSEECDPTEDTMRLQFGVLMPPGYAGIPHSEFDNARTECLLEPEAGSTLRVLLRFLQVKNWAVEVRTHDAVYLEVPALTVEDHRYTGWDETEEREVAVELTTTELLCGPTDVPFVLEEEEGCEAIDGCGRAGRLRWRTEASRGEMRIEAVALSDPDRLLRLRIDILNTTPWTVRRPDRPTAMRHAMLATHLVLIVDSGQFVSLVDPPDWAEAAAESCRGERMWPVLIGEPGERQALLASPIILYDYPLRDDEPPAEVRMPTARTPEHDIRELDLRRLIPGQLGVEDREQRTTP
jgi:hypothetical protein